MSTRYFPIPLNFKCHSSSSRLLVSFITTNPNSLHFPSKFLRNSFLHPVYPFPAKFHLYSLGAASPEKNLNPSATDQSDQQDHHLSIAQKSFSQFLFEEIGISPEESRAIAFGSPKYAQMIIDSVRDLEDWNSWRGNGQGGFEGLNGDSGFKEKVVYMVKEKGDGGKVAFLESLGLSLSSAMSLARYLSSESLPSLIHKVTYVKEIFFSGSNSKGLAGKNARRMMMYLSIPIDEDVQQTLSFFEKIDARRGGLDMLGSLDVSFRFLVESFPQLLLLSPESHLEPVVEFLESMGVDRGCLGKVLLLFPPIMFCQVEEIKRKVSALEKVAAVDKDVGKMLLKYPWVLSTSILENYDKIISLFDVEKVPRVDIDRAIKRWPHILGCSISKLKLMVDQVGELGVRNKKFGRAIVTSPQLLLRKPEEVLQVVLFLEDLGFDKEIVGKILCRCPEVFAASVEKTLKRKLEFLAGFGVSRRHFPRVIKKYPEFLVSDVDRTIVPRMKYLMEIGLSKRDIAFMVRRFSPLLGYSINEVLRPKFEFLMNTMEKPVTEVVDYPRYFSYSLEKKIKPRFWVLKGRNIECSLEDMLGKNNEEFAAEFMGVGRMLVPPSLVQE